MDTEQSSASRATPTTPTDLARIRGDRGRFLRGLDLARRKPSEYPYAERPARIGEGRYRIPSRTTDRRYLVELEDPSCECSDWWYGNTCQHLYCAMILDSRRRLRMARLVTCHGCPDRIRYGDTVEVHEDHDSLTCFVGDLLCPDCARQGGIS